MDNRNHILLCNCEDAGIGNVDSRQRVREVLTKRGIPFSEIPDLCRLVANHDSALQNLASDGDLTIIACHPRAVHCMLDAAGIAIKNEALHLMDLRSMSADAILDTLPEAIPASTPDSTDANDDWRPWFPVIDYDRCSNCGQCMNFCLFGVYSRSPEGKVTVTNPRGCKYNCPACARICPEVAIMFPKLPDSESPINGDTITDEENVKARARVNADELLGDDLYAALAKRRQKARKRLLKTQQERQAEAERAACSDEAGIQQPKNKGQSS